jgi:SET domain-containing protein
MALLERQLVVKKSTLPGSGKGLFTKALIPKGSRIVEYKGKVSTWKDVNHNNGKNGYIYYVTRNFVIDASGYKKALARFANDAKGLSRVKGFSNNSIYQLYKGKVYIESVKDIQPNSEILVEYGKEYWDVIRHNARLTAQELKQAKKKSYKKKKSLGKKSSGKKSSTK